MMSNYIPNTFLVTLCRHCMDCGQSLGSLTLVFFGLLIQTIFTIILDVFGMSFYIISSAKKADIIF